MDAGPLQEGEASDSDISLPDSVRSDDGPPDEDEWSLPPDVCEDDHAPDACCKKGNCKSKFQESELQAYELQFANCSQELRLKKVYEQVREVFKAGGSDPKKLMPWSVLGQPVCRRFFEGLHGIGHGSLDKLVNLAKNGHVDVPTRGPRLKREAPALATVDTWFVSIYRDLAEPLALPGSGNLAESDGPDPGASSKDSDMVEHEIVAADHPLAALSLNLRQSNADADPHGRVYVPKRYLNFGSEQQIWNFYQEDEDVAHQISRSTFRKAWEKWRRFLPLKNSGEGSKCNACASLTLQRSEATEPSERVRIDGLKQAHLQTVMADRNFSVRCNKAASRPDVWQTAKNQSLFCKLEIDGMDQSKFSIPRMKQMAGTSSYSKCWRPAVHVTVALLFGQIEYYAVMRPDLAKDSNMNATITCRVLDLMQEKLDALGAGHSFPGELVVMCDNTPREAKNSHFGCFLSSLVGRSLFSATEVHFLQVDHTHNELDQRFSTLASHIKQADVIEDIADLVLYLQTHVTAAANRTLIVEELNSTMDFKKYLSSVNLHLSGLTSTHMKPNANHMWRFAHRLSIDESHHGAIECHHQDWTGLQQHPSDVVLIVKQFLSSPSHSQAPQVVLPLEIAEGLTGKLEAAPRNKFAETTLTEFRKSAMTFGNQPWNLLKAKYFLEELCDLNEKEELPPCVDLKFFFSAEPCQVLVPQAADRLLPEDGEDDQKDESAEPRRVIAGRRGAGKAKAAKAKAKPKVKAAVKMAAVRKRPAAAVAVSADAAESEAGAPVRKRPSSSSRDRLDAAVAAELPEDFYFGCSKCRHSENGCAECQNKADASRSGWKRLSNGMVIRALPSA